MPELTMTPHRLELLNLNLSTEMGRSYLGKIRTHLSPLVDDDLVNSVADLQHEFEKAEPIFGDISEYLEESSNPHQSDLETLNEALTTLLETFPEPE